MGGQEKLLVEFARRADRDRSRPRLVARPRRGVPAAAGRNGGRPVVTVARLSPEKDIETLLRAVAVAVRTDPGFRLEVAGDGVCMPVLRQLAKELDLDQHVRFLGQVRDVPALLARASLFVLPSRPE